jgi:thioredoxin reductase
MRRRYDLVVIGSGPAGEKGAAQVAYFGKRVAPNRDQHGDRAIDTFIDSVYNYPALSDSYKYAAYDGSGNLRAWRAARGS